MELYNHQKEIINNNPLWKGLWLGTGAGKSRLALELAQGMTLCIVPKQQKADKNFEETAKKYGINKEIHVISKEEFRRDWEELPRFDTVIIDECHAFTGVTTDTYTKNRVLTPKSSEMFKSLYYYLKKHPPTRFYPMSATPASKPMNVYALSHLFGNPLGLEYFSFRSKYYIERKKGYQTFWIPRTDAVSQQELADMIKSLGYTGQLSDWFDVPDQTHKVINIDLHSDQKECLAIIEINEADPMVLRAKQRTIENGCLYGVQTIHTEGKEFHMRKETQYINNNKLDHITQLSEEFPKLLVFANYIAQIEQIAHHMQSLGKKVYILHGQVKDRESVISGANGADNCIVIAQCGVSAGYELPDFRCTVFASKSYRVLDYLQGLGRTLRANNLQKNLFVHLVIKGGVDEACHKSIMAGEDFQEKIYET
jgi:superfamily II DNA or RNA helicase